MATSHKNRTRKTATIPEQEGFSRAIGVAEGGVPTCSSFVLAHKFNLADFRGDVTGGKTSMFLYPAHGDRNSIEWETSRAKAKRATTFVWIGGSQLRPAFQPCFPYPTARLFVDGVERLTFPVGTVATFGNLGFKVEKDDVMLTFEPRRTPSLVEQPHRTWQPHGFSGFYRLTVPGRLLRKGKPLKLRVELPKHLPEFETFYYVSPRRDALKADVATLREEVRQLQLDMVQLRQSHEMLYAQVYPQLFPKRIQGELVIAHQDPTRHYHPSSVTVMRDGEVVITAREAVDHLDPGGRMILVRSKDGGRTWGPKEVMYDLGNSDHRSAPITELANGDWVSLDYRFGCGYKHRVFEPNGVNSPTLWGVWSADRGKSWQFTKDPLCVPDAHPYAENERHPIQLPGGRVLAAVNYLEWGPGRRIETWEHTWIAVFRSDDNGRSWQLHAKVPHNPWIIGECSMVRAPSGKIILIARSEAWSGKDWTKKGMLYQSVSRDDGQSWSELKPTALSSMSSPGHLLQLQDGRILCTHASRSYPGSVYATVSHYEGETWDTAHTRVIANDIVNDDSCYPNSGQLADGTIITTWYANLFGKFFLPAFRWSPDAL